MKCSQKHCKKQKKTWNVFKNLIKNKKKTKKKHDFWNLWQKNEKSWLSSKNHVFFFFLFWFLQGFWTHFMFFLFFIRFLNAYHVFSLLFTMVLNAFQMFLLLFAQIWIKIVIRQMFSTSFYVQLTMFVNTNYGFNCISECLCRQMYPKFHNSTLCLRNNVLATLWVSTLSLNQVAQLLSQLTVFLYKRTTWHFKLVFAQKHRLLKYKPSLRFIQVKSCISKEFWLKI